jgi:alpha-glucosidase
VTIAETPNPETPESEPDVLATATGHADEWWRSAVIYQIYPRSFADANGDGVGDLAGIADRLGALVELGVDALWLSPFYRSPQRDAGYDVADYCDVDPLFGTLADFDHLLVSAHERGLKVIVDLVPNHSSSDHPRAVPSGRGTSSATARARMGACPPTTGSPFSAASRGPA